MAYVWLPSRTLARALVYSKGCEVHLYDSDSVENQTLL